MQDVDAKFSTKYFEKSKNRKKEAGKNLHRCALLYERKHLSLVRISNGILNGLHSTRPGHFFSD